MDTQIGKMFDRLKSSEHDFLHSFFSNRVPILLFTVSQLAPLTVHLNIINVLGTEQTLHNGLINTAPPVVSRSTSGVAGNLFFRGTKIYDLRVFCVQSDTDSTHSPF